MPVTSTPVLVQTPSLGLVTILPADTTSLKTLVTAGTNGSKVTGVTLATDETSARTIELWVTRSATNYLLGAANVPIGAGSTAGVNAVDLMGVIPGLPIDNDGQPYLLLMSGDVLKVSCTGTITAAKTMYAAAVYGDF